MPWGSFDAENYFAAWQTRLEKRKMRRTLALNREKIRKGIMAFYDPAAHTFGNGTHDSLALGAMG